MTLREARHQLETLAQQWNRRQLTSWLLTLGLALIVFATGGMTLGLSNWNLLAAGVALAVAQGLILWTYSDGPWRVNEWSVASDLNCKYPEFQHSCQLLLVPEDELTGLAKLQRARVLGVIAERTSDLRTTQPSWLKASLMVIATTVFVLLSAKLVDGVTSGDPAGLTEEQGATPPPSLNVEQLTVSVTPPEYTGRAPTTFDTLNVQAPAGSEVRWDLLLSAPTQQVELRFSQQNSIAFTTDDGTHFTAQGTASFSDFYRLHTDRAGEDTSTTLARFDVLPDQPPAIQVLTPQIRTELPPQTVEPVTVEVEVSDDYGVAEAMVQVTVATGQGEGVRFRDQTIEFDRQQRISPGHHRYSLELDLRALQMAPGDELYFYVVATDNRQPNPQLSRSDMHFVVLKNPQQQSVIAMPGIAVNRMPAYFRSQRQIIIDTEKLLDERDSLDDSQFHRRCQALGLDQKALRLRYGQFLGEEAESGTSAADLPDNLVGGADSHVAPRLPDSAQPDTEHNHEEHNHEEHGHEQHGHEEHEHEEHHEGEHTDEIAPPPQDQHVDAHEHEHEHEHEAGGSTANSVSAVQELYGHSHDSILNATFFSGTIKRQLKAALAEMWDSELRLHTYRPAEALPYQRRALEKLKIVQQASRIYVQRVGFEPPPLRTDEARFSGDLEDVEPHDETRQIAVRVLQPRLRNGLQVLDRLATADGSRLINRTGIRQLESAGQELARLALEEPGADLGGLQALRNVIDSLANEAEPQSDQVERARRAIWQRLEMPESRVNSTTGHRSPLSDAYFNALKTNQPLPTD